MFFWEATNLQRGFKRERVSFVARSLGQPSLGFGTCLNFSSPWQGRFSRLLLWRQALRFTSFRGLSDGQ